MNRPQFVVSYAGYARYLWKGREYEIVSHSMGIDFPWAKGVLEEHKALCGTIRNSNSGAYHDFPPDEVAAFWPGYIPVRWSADWKLEYKGGVAPQVEDDPVHTGGVVASAWVRSRDAWEEFSTELHKLIDIMPYSEYSRFRESIDWHSWFPTELDKQRVADMFLSCAHYFQAALA